MRGSASLIGLAALAVLSAHAADSPIAHLVGHYSDGQMEAVHTLILPRVFLYDANNQLVPDDQWPTELADVKKHKGDGRCCLSYVKSTSSGPPPDCVNPIYGDEGANLSGLMDEKGAKIDFQTAPPHKWLIVEYAAAWCTPCVVQEMKLKHLFASTKNASDYAWITIDMTRIRDVKDALKKANGT